MVDNEAGAIVYQNERNERWDCDIDNKDRCFTVIFEDTTLSC